MLLSFLIVSVLVTVSISTRTFHPDDPWETWKNLFGKRYNTQDEEYLRLNIWLQNAMKVINHNVDFKLGKASFSLALNHLTDLTDEEFVNMYLGIRPSEEEIEDEETVLAEEEVENKTQLPRSIDWRNTDRVTHVKSQKRCGACYAFSALGAIEGQLTKNGLPLTSLSEQQIVDCAKGFTAYGCSGGRPSGAFKYIKKYGIMSQKNYPYKAKKGKCTYNKDLIVTKIKSFKQVKPKTEKALANAVATIGPISVLVTSNTNNFRHYKNGILYDTECTPRKPVDHGMLLVGFGEENGQKYWILKNSWGKRWGKNGYVYLARDRGNHCKIASAATYPVL
ncbi:procathepsin L-like [Callorhinchus milii]|uniref:procathepsin L-like n=1 Tax=Callorhinchus milii TaxID=7868 RepID=UPI001C3FB1E4|nr:procathepsin L-like [Callorhinchus milii]